MGWNNQLELEKIKRLEKALSKSNLYAMGLQQTINSKDEYLKLLIHRAVGYCGLMEIKKIEETDEGISILLKRC